jgi:5-methylcytosine-specific restriction endonuclease McrA
MFRGKPRRFTVMSSQSYPDNWADLSRQIKQRDGNMCRKCGSSVNLEVHHIIPLSRNGSNNRSNLMTLCSKCHARQHTHLMKRRLTKP